MPSEPRLVTVRKHWDEWADDYQSWAAKLLPEGTRVRSAAEPSLTGVIKHYEWTNRDTISPIPYCIGWDDSHEAARLLGWLFVYSSPEGVVAL